jgi:hypothetical protein|tara:strand:- start:833 stop:1132 length:300 start_codon:yes stop_codon:yes gene_type:complete
MFDPNELTVKDARLRLSELDLDGLEVVLKAEIDGKHRSSLIADIGRAIDSIKTAEDNTPEAVTPKAAPEKRSISVDQWARLSRNDRKYWVSLGGVMVEK